MNRIILNETSYHGAGAITAIVSELAARGLKKPIVFTDPDLVKFGVSKKVFKQAVGDLYKRQIITIEDQKIELKR